mgnify:CR=1 FL=1
MSLAARRALLRDDQTSNWLCSKRPVTSVRAPRAQDSGNPLTEILTRDVLTVRGLAQRGKLSTDDAVLSFLARRADNGVAWKILEYWRATN